MPIFMIIALDIVITLRFSINYSAVICSPTVIFSILREASSETYGPRVYLLSYLLSICFYLHLYFLHLYHKIPKIYLPYHSIFIILFSYYLVIFSTIYFAFILLCIFITKIPKILSYHIYQISLS